jgi:cytochrome c2
MRHALALTVLCAFGCQQQPARVATGGNPEHGMKVVDEKGCGACHRIPGLRAARGVVGPPLELFARRSFIGGRLPNTPQNLVRWLKDPRAIDPSTAMPMLGLDDGEARDVAAFLYTLN